MTPQKSIKDLGYRSRLHLEDHLETYNKALKVYIAENGSEAKAHKRSLPVWQRFVGNNVKALSTLGAGMKAITHLSKSRLAHGDGDLALQALVGFVDKVAEYGEAAYGIDNKKLAVIIAQNTKNTAHSKFMEQAKLLKECGYDTLAATFTSIGKHLGEDIKPEDLPTPTGN